VCETASKKVRQALIETDGKLNCYYSFVGRLPATSEHNHLVGEVIIFDVFDFSFTVTHTVDSLQFES